MWSVRHSDQSGIVSSETSPKRGLESLRTPWTHCCVPNRSKSLQIGLNRFFPNMKCLAWGRILPGHARVFFCWWLPPLGLVLAESRGLDVHMGAHFCLGAHFLPGDVFCLGTYLGLCPACSVPQHESIYIIHTYTLFFVDILAQAEPRSS